MTFDRCIFVRILLPIFGFVLSFGDRFLRNLWVRFDSLSTWDDNFPVVLGSRVRLLNICTTSLVILIIYYGFYLLASSGSSSILLQIVQFDLTNIRWSDISCALLIHCLLDSRIRYQHSIILATVSDQVWYPQHFGARSDIGRVSERNSMTVRRTSNQPSHRCPIFHSGCLGVQCCCFAISKWITQARTWFLNSRNSWSLRSESIMQLGIGLEFDNSWAHMIICNMRFVSHISSGGDSLLRLSVITPSCLIRMKTKEVINLLFLGVRGWLLWRGGYSGLAYGPSTRCHSVLDNSWSLSSSSIRFLKACIHSSTVDSSHLHFAILHVSNDLLLMDDAIIHSACILLNTHCIILLSILLGWVSRWGWIQI